MSGLSPRFEIRSTFKPSSYASSSARSKCACSPTRVGFVLNEDIDIAILAKIVAKHRAEQGQFAHLIPAADLGQFFPVNLDAVENAHGNSTRQDVSQAYR